MKKFYAGIVLAGMMTAALAVTGCSNPAGEDTVYSIVLDQTGAYAFPEADVGYGAQTAKTVTVTNTGNRATGALTIGKSGANAGSFTVSKASLNSIAAGGTDTFTVAPNTGLGAGTYAATIAVSGGNDINESFTVSFTVNSVENPDYSIGLSETGTYVFPAATEGYGAQTDRTVTITNTGEQAAGALIIGKSGANAGSFTVSKTGINDIAAGGTDTFTVAPNTGLVAGTYTAAITVSGGNDISESFTVSFTVTDAPGYAISLSETGTYIFTAAMTGYEPQTARTITVSNTGDLATGALTIGKSGANADSFTVSPASLASIAAGRTGAFTVAPNTGLAAGTYTAVIAVTGGNGIGESFNVSFTVNPPTPAYSVGLSEDGTYAFPGVDAGYGAQTARTITIVNTGNQATGALTIGKSGANAGSFTVSPASLSGIAVGGTGAFTVVPNTGLAAGSYAASIAVSGENSISAGFDVSFTVTVPRVYSISLDQTEPYAFPSAAAGYGAQTAKTVTVANTGNQATGALTIGKSGANAGNFTVSPVSLSGIAVGGNAGFTVVPARGLAAGSYAATITVSGGNSISAGFDVSFTVTVPPVYSISLDQTEPYAFPGAETGYAAQTTKTVTVANTGNQATGALTVGKSGANPGDFTVSKTSLNSIAVGGTDTFTVVPNIGLAAGSYSATITVSGENNINANFAVSFTVTVPYDINLSETGTYDFSAGDTVYAGYVARAARTVAIANTGNRATGTLTIAKSGANPGNFTVSAASLNSIAAGGTGAFTVVPNTGLGAGTYTAAITVSGGNGISESFDVSFTVTAVDTPIYSVELSEIETYTFPAASAGYTALTARTVTITNKGNYATGALTIDASGANPGDFTVSETGIADIGINGNDTFTVVPNTGLGVGTYTAIITVSGGNGISESFNVSFTVTVPPVYSISLDQTGTYSFPGALPDYGTQTAKTVTVSNTGNQVTGTLTVGRSGANAASFTVSAAGLSSIAVSGTGSFTVVPVTGLGTGTYTATITVSGANGISSSFEVSFTVYAPGAPVYTVTFDASGGMPAISTAQTGYDDNTVTLPGNPGRTGYTFSGWYTEANGGGAAFTATTPVTADATVYAKWLSANANLASLSVDAGWLDQTFSPSTTSYTMTVPYTTTSVTVSATEGDFGKASVAFPDGNPVSLNPGPNTIRVRVTAEDGSATRTYTITVTRTPLSANANLSSLGVSAGTLNPAFSAAATVYTVLVPDGTSSITVTAAVADTGKAALAPSSPHMVSLDAASTDITLRVTAEDGTAKDYTVTVNKTTAANAIDATIGIADERIDLTRNTENDLSRELNNTLRLTAPEGYANYTWFVDMGSGSYNAVSDRIIELNANWYGYSYGTHSVLLEYTKDGITHGCEVMFKVVR